PTRRPASILLPRRLIILALRRRPLGGAVMHELDLFLPAALREEEDRRSVLFFKFKAQLCADPFLRAVHALPSNTLIGLKFQDLHVVEALVVEAELNNRSNSGRSLYITSPPAGEAFLGGQSPIDLLRRCLDSDPM